MLKKLSLSLLLVVLSLAVVACKASQYKVTFNTQGGSSVEAVFVDKGKLVEEPVKEPTKASNNLLGWYKDAAGNEEYDFATPVNGNLTLYACWSTEVVVRFNTKLGGVIAPLELGASGGPVSEPAAPSKEGFDFKGWYYGKAGLTWLEESPITFPINVTSATRLHAYYEPVNSKDVVWSKGETYTTSLTSDSALILNPLVYTWAHESDFIDMMSTSLYSTEVDWDKAIAQGVADHPGDFSKIEAKEYSVEALDYTNILVGATHYPKDSNGDEYLTDEGKYDRDNASTFKDTEWTFTLRDDLYFEDGTKITASTYEYTLKQYLDPQQNNMRGSSYYRNPDDANANGYQIAGAYEYFMGEEGATWDKVGFEVLSEYSFKIKTWEPIAQSSAVGFGNIRLVHPEKYAASLTAGGTKSNYGTPDHKFMSYGSYIIKSWDENQRLVLNKNYNYVLKGTINYKCYTVEIVDNVDQRMQFFKDGTLSVAGLSQDYYADYAEYKNLYRSWMNYPMYLVMNLADAKNEGADARPTIMYDAKFRQALFYGFDRAYYANNVYAPNYPSTLTIPYETKVYVQDALYYSESPVRLEMLENNGVNIDNHGYSLSYAQGLFNEAYASWVADGNSGAVKIRFVIENDSFSVNLANHIESMWETAFGKDKLDIVVDDKDANAVSADLANWDFDIQLSSLGYGVSYGAYWWYPIASFYFGNLAASYGVTTGFDSSQPDGKAAYLNEVIEADLTSTYTYLTNLGEDYLEEKQLTGHLNILNLLKESTEGGVTKPAGQLKATLLQVIGMMMSDEPWDAVSSEPFPGATSDMWNLLAALEEVFLEYMPLVPIITRSSATVYQDNVVITWPEEHSLFGWGAARYRYLNTDPDFR